MTAAVVVVVTMKTRWRTRQMSNITLFLQMIMEEIVVQAVVVENVVRLRLRHGVAVEAGVMEVGK